LFFILRNIKNMLCPICIGAAISKIAQGAGVIGVAKHVNDKAKQKSSKSKSCKSKSNENNKKCVKSI
tara:strand:+ start:876 stop:1076 length:201 start_codon:yes stop_codon:yes gene_type:complete